SALLEALPLKHGDEGAIAIQSALHRVVVPLPGEEQGKGAAGPDLHIQPPTALVTRHDSEVLPPNFSKTKGAHRGPGSRPRGVLHHVSELILSHPIVWCVGYQPRYDLRGAIRRQRVDRHQREQVTIRIKVVI